MGAVLELDFKKPAQEIAPRPEVSRSRLVWTAAINERMAQDERFCKFILSCLRRHNNGDWGDLCKEDKQANDYALTHDERLLSSYLFQGSEKVWIITEWDRSATTVLFPEEY